MTSNLHGLLLVPSVLGTFDAAFGALGGLLRTRIDRRRRNVPA